MDKNRIHIDDLVRNRLSGAEEKEPAGAWSSMRDLLDKEMPVETAAFNWRRMLGYATAVILATSVSVGGYNYYRHAITVPAHPVAAKTSTPSSSKSSKNNTTNVATLAATAANSNHQSPIATASGTIASTHHSPSNHTQSGASHTNAATPQIGNSTVAVSALEKTNTPEHSSSTAAIVASSDNELGKPASTISPSRELAANHNAPASLNSNIHTTPKNQSANQSAASSIDALAHNPVSNHPVLASGSTGINKTEPSIGGNSLAGKPAFTLSKDTIRQIEIAYRRVVNEGNRSLKYVQDTLAVTNLIVEKRKPIAAPVQHPETQNQVAVNKPFIPAPAKPTAIAKATSEPVASNPVPMAAALNNAEAIAASDNIKLVSLSQFRVASKFNKFWNAERFHLMVQNVKADLSRAQFYAGMTGGLNASLFTATAMAGFQAGLTGLLTFGDEWSIAGELKFYQRFNTGNSIKDNYIKKDNWVAGSYNTVNGVQYREWNWREDTVAHSFNFTTIQTIELPLLLRYNAGRFFAEAGINMMYAFAVNVEEIDKPNGNPKTVSRQMPATFTPESVSGNMPSINSGDFGSRFGLGYALGLGYQITPAIQTNIRMVHSVWDNSSSVGAGKVSQNLYQTPSIQFSIGYRFKQGKGR